MLLESLHETDLALTSPMALAIVTTNGKTANPPHLDLLNRNLLDVAAGVTKNLMVFMPPRHGKSELVSRWFPAWYLLNFPEHRIMLSSYEASFAASWGKKARDIIEFWAQYVGLRIDPSKGASEWWELQRRIANQQWRNTGGAMYSVGVGGGLTGKGGNVVIIDDPIKNAEESMSQTIRQKQFDWYLSTLSTRAEPHGATIIVQTRWNDDDLSGRILKEANEIGEDWKVISLPAIAGENDPLGRAEGEALWPERYDVDKLEATERKIGPYWFSALYQQQPIPEGKAIFQQRWLGRWSYINETRTFRLARADGTSKFVDKRACSIFSTVDLATSIKQTADFTVVSTWAKTPDSDLLLLDVQRQRLEGPEHVRLLQSVYATWRPYAFYIEQAGFQLSTIQYAMKASLPVVPVIPDRDKLARALPAAARMQQGMYYFPEGKPFAEAEAELWSFPAGAHDDFVDTVSLSILIAEGTGVYGTAA